MCSKRKLNSEDDLNVKVSHFENNLNDEISLKQICHLTEFIVEKLTAKDFATFNLCCKWADKECRKLRKETKLLLEVEKLVLGTSEEFIQFDPEGYEAMEISDLPEYIRLKCRALEVSIPRMEIIDRHLVRTEELHIENDDLLENVDLLKELIQKTQPTSLECSGDGDVDCEEIFRMDEVQKMTSLKISCDDLSDEVFLKLQASKMEISGHPEVSLEGILQLIDEWKRGEREIEWIRMDGFCSEEAEEEVAKKFGESGEEGHFERNICRSEGHKDCLRLYYAFENGLELYSVQEECGNL